MKLFISLLLTVTSFTLFATEISMQEPIDINGSFTKPKLTQSQRLKLIRKKLEKRNERLVKKQIEMIRYQQEVELMRKMQAMFKKNMNEIEKI